MTKCAHCGKEVDAKHATKLRINGQTHFFHWHHISSVTQRVLSHVVLSKSFAELVAIGTGLSGIVYTLLGFANRALIMDTFSAIAAIAALFVGIEHLKYLRQHDLLRRATLLVGIGLLFTIAILVWHFGFRLE